MAKDDQWCELCEDKLKDKIINFNGRKLGVCSHCASLTTEE